MNETPEMIRKQMEQTKLQLAAKLESLEQQVSTTVHTTETAVTATMGAVETVTGAVHNTVDSVANLLDVSRHVEKHPWLVVGGAAVVGYLAAEFLTGKASECISVPEARSNRSTNQLDGASVAASLAHTASNTVGHPSSTESSAWHQLSDAAIGSMISLVPQILSRIIPLVVDRLIDNWNQPPKDSSSTSGESEVPDEPSPIESHQLRIAHSGTTWSKKID